MPQTIEQALEWARAHVPWEDARALMRHALACDSAYLIAYAGIELDEPRLRSFRGLVERRITGEPVAYLTGAREFYALPLKVTPAVLIPRHETELLVDTALDLLPAGRRCRVLDLGTGSGCVALAIAHHRPDSEVIATDASPGALVVARENAAAVGAANVDLRAGDWFDPVRDVRFDAVLANPPYVAAGDPHLAEGDLRFEPRAALVSGTDGLDAIRIIVAAAPAHLEHGGFLAIEHGYEQGKACRKLFAQAGFEKVGSRSDLAGHERVTIGHRA